MRAIITFHSIDDSGSILSFTPRKFAKLLGALERCELNICDLDTLLSDKTRSGIALTFDDGMRSVYTHALPILKDYAVPSHLFLTTAAVAGTNRWHSQPRSAPSFDMLNWNEIEQLRRASVSIDAHTHNHMDMRNLSYSEIETQCELADDIIEARTGRRPRYFAYPYGYFDAKSRDYMRVRYRASATTELRELKGQEDKAALPRLDSYYLNASWVSQNINAPLPRAYLGLRGLLRTLRGSR